MAETHLINIVANFKDNASKNLNAARIAVGNLNDEFKKGIPAAQQQRREIDNLNEAHKSYTNQLKNEIVATKDNIAVRQKYQKMVKDQVAFERELGDQKRKLARLEKEHEKSIVKQSEALKAHIPIVTKLGAVYDGARSNIRKFNDEAERNKTVLGKLSVTMKEFGRDNDALTRRLQKTFYAIRGLAVGGVIIFMNGLISSFVALGGQAVALVGSLGLVATTLGGVLLPAIAQAIPAVGLLAAAFQRLSVIQEALQAQDSIRQQSAQTDKTQQEAQRESANQLADARRGVADAERGVADAQEGVKEAQEGVKDAQDELNDSREQATRDLQDLTLAEKDAQLAAQGAALSLREARNALEDLIQEGASPDEIERARLDVKSAQQDQVHSQLEAQRATEDANEAQKRGVEGSEAVVQAKEQLSDASKAVAEAEQGVADAQRGVADASRDVAEAHREAANAADAQSAAESNLKFLLDQLSPAERGLFNQITKLKQRFKEEFRPITDIIIESFSTGLKRASDLLFDKDILQGFKSLASGIADAFNDITKAFTNSEFTDFWELMLSEGEKNLGPLTDILINIGKLFIRVAKGAAPVLAKLLKLIADETERWADSSKDTSSITQFFERGLKHIRAWFGLLKAVVGLFSALAGASSRSALDTIGSLTDTVNEASESIRDNFKEVQKFFDDSSDATSALGDLVVALGDALIDIFDPKSVQALVDIFTNILIPAFTTSVQLLGKLVILVEKIASAPVIGDILKLALAFTLLKNSVVLLYGILVRPMVLAIGLVIDGIGILVSAVTGAIGGFGAFGLTLKGLLVGAGSIAAVIAGIVLLAEVFDKIRPTAIHAFNAITNSLGDAVKFIRDKLGIIGKLFTDAVKIIIAPFKAMVTTFVNVFDGVLKIVHGFVHGDFGEVWGGIKQVIAAPFKAVLELLDTLIQPFEDAANALKDVFVSVFSGLGDILADVFTKAFDVMLGGVSTLIDGVVGAMQAIPDVISPPGFQTLADNLDDIGNSIDDFRESQNESSDETQKHTKVQKESNAQLQQNRIGMGQFTDTTKKDTKEKEKNRKETDKGTQSQKDFGKETDDTTKKQDHQKDSTRDLRKALSILAGNFVGAGNTSRDMGDMIGKVANEILSGFGADKVKFSLPARKDFSGAISNGVLAGGGFAQGGWIGKPGEIGPDDRWINVAGGEVAIANHHQQAPIEMALAYSKASGVVPYGSLGELFNKETRPHSQPGFQKGGYATGGIVPIPGFPGESIDARILPDVLKLVKAYKLFISDGYSTDPVHAASGEHPLGLATDIVPGPGGSWGLVTELAHWAEPVQDQPIDPFRWVGYDGDANHGEGNHLHLSWAHGPGFPAEWVSTLGRGKLESGKAGGILAEKLKRLKVKGPKGHLKDMLQGQANKMRNAANKLIAKKSLSGVESGGGFALPGNVGGSVVRQMGQILLANGFSAAGAAGIIGNAYAESTWNPGAVGTGGGGLFGFTTSPVSLADLQDFAAQRKVPWTSVPLQMEMMLTNPHAGGSGGLLSDSYYTSTEAQLKKATDAASAANIFMTDWERPGIPALDRRVQGAMQALQIISGLSSGKRKKNRGGFVSHDFPSFDSGGVVPGPRGKSRLIEAHGGETILPTHKYAGGGIVGKSSTQRQLNDPFPDPQQEIKDIFKELAKVFKDVEGLDGFLKGIEDIIRSGGMLDDIGTLLEKYSTRLARKLTDWSLEIVKIGRGKNGEEIVAQIRTAVEIADRTLDNLEKIGETMSAELEIINDLIKRSERKLKKTDKKSERQKLIGTINDLTTRQEELLDALASNMQERLDAQRAAIEARFARLDQKKGLLSTQAAIIAARAELSGDTRTTGSISNLNDQSTILNKERRVIKDDLKDARKSGDTERERELNQALKDNTLATLENNIAIKDVLLQGFQDALDKLDIQLNTIDIRSQIVEALTTLSGGNVNFGQGSSLLNQQASILKDQAAVLQNQLAKATAMGDQSTIDTTNAAILDNTLAQIATEQALKDLKFSVLDQLIDRLSTAFGTLDIRKQILEATSTLIGGDIKGTATKALLDIQRENLTQQRTLLEAQLRKAQAIGDPTLIAQYTDALAQNNVALIENVQAIKDLNLAIIQEQLDHLNATLSQIDLRTQIVNAISTLQGSDTNAGALNTLLNQQKEALLSQRQILQGQLSKAQATGDKKLIEETIQALLQNKLELINLKQAVKDLQIQQFVEAIGHLNALISQFDIRRQILEIQAELSGVSTTAEQIALVQKTIDNLTSQRVLLEQELAEAIQAGDSKRIEEMTQALLENELATLQNTKTLKELEGTLGKVVNFNSTAWQLWRHAIFNGMGGIMPNMPIPSLASGGNIIQSGLANVHRGEAIVPAKINRNIQETLGSTGDTIIQITEPMEVADPVALSNAIGMKLKTNKGINR